MYALLLQSTIYNLTLLFPYDTSRCIYSILFFPSSRPSSLASLFPRSCLVPTKLPTTGF
jgi:hypothetical protein